MRDLTCPCRLLIAALLLGSVACGQKTVRTGAPVPGAEARDGTPTAVQAGSAGPEPTASSTCTGTASLAQAQSVVPFPLLVPTAVPAGYRLVKVDCQRFPVPLVVLHYAWPDGPPGRYGGQAGFVFRQGPLFLRLPYVSGDPRFSCAEGTATVQGQPAVWQRQQYNISLPDDVCKGANAAGGRLTGPELDWVASGGNPAVGYQLQSDDLSLDQLIAIADSMRPYDRP